MAQEGIKKLIDTEDSHLGNNVNEMLNLFSNKEEKKLLFEQIKPVVRKLANLERVADIEYLFKHFELDKQVDLAKEAIDSLHSSNHRIIQLLIEGFPIEKHLELAKVAADKIKLTGNIKDNIKAINSLITPLSDVASEAVFNKELTQSAKAVLKDLRKTKEIKDTSRVISKGIKKIGRLF